MESQQACLCKSVFAERLVIVTYLFYFYSMAMYPDDKYPTQRISPGTNSGIGLHEQKIDPLRQMFDNYINIVYHYKKLCLVLSIFALQE